MLCLWLYQWCFSKVTNSVLKINFMRLFYQLLKKYTDLRFLVTAKSESTYLWLIPFSWLSSLEHTLYCVWKNLRREKRGKNRFVKVEQEKVREEKEERGFAKPQPFRSALQPFFLTFIFCFSWWELTSNRLTSKGLFIVKMNRS